MLLADLWPVAGSACPLALHTTLEPNPPVQVVRGVLLWRSAAA